MSTPCTPRSRNRGLRVALVCPYSLSRPGGVQGQVVGLARSLASRGHEVTAFAPLDDPSDRPDCIDLVVSGRSVPFPSNGSRAPVSISPKAAAEALAALRSRRFDVVHLHEPFAPGLPYALLLASGLPPLVGTFHRSGGSLFYSALKPLVGRLARRLSARCAVSDAARRTAQSATGGEYLELFNGVEIERYRDAVPWPVNGPTILFLGRHEARKGLRTLLEALALSEAAPAPTVWIAGDGPETARLSRQFPGSERIQWLGVLSEEEKVRRLAAADVLCAPSLGGESFGMVLVEAMAAGTLVVASDIDGYRQAAGSDAVWVTPGDSAALATVLASVLSTQVRVAGDSDRPDDRTAQASARAEQWSMRRLAELYEQVYHRAVEARP